MMYKKKVIALIVCSFVFLILLCNASSADKSSFTDNAQQEVIIHRKQTVPDGIQYRADYPNKYLSENLLDNSEKLSESNMYIYDEKDLLYNDKGGFAIGYDSGYYRTINIRGSHFERILKIYPGPAIRKIADTNHVYFVYDTDKGTRLFVFFTERDNYYLVTGYPVIMKKKLSYSDFANLKTGDTLEMVAEIDPVIPVYKERIFDRINDAGLQNIKKIGLGLTSVHLLTDGILKLEYDRTGENEYYITKITYSSDFVLDGICWETCYKILDIDYVE